MNRNIHRPAEPRTNTFAAESTEDTLPAGDSAALSPVFEEPEVPPRIYACGVERPESAQPVFVVFEDGIRVSEFTLNAASSDADAHFLVGPDLYIAVTEGPQTSVYKNGVREFSFPAKEYLTDLIRGPDGIWTLGANRSGDGFTLRRNGDAVFSKTGGSPGRLYMDEGHLYFDYALTVGGKALRYLVKDGDDYALSAPNGGELLAVTVSNEEMWFLETCPDGWLLSCDETRYQYRSRPGFGFRSAELYGTALGCAAVINMVALAFGMPAELVCREENEWLKGGGSGSYHYYDSEPDVHISFTGDMDKLVVSGYDGKDSEALDGVRFEGSRCAMQYGGQTYIACTPTDGSPPFIWKRGNMRMTLELDGYLTGIYVEPAG